MQCYVYVITPPGMTLFLGPTVGFRQFSSVLPGLPACAVRPEGTDPPGRTRTGPPARETRAFGHAVVTSSPGLAALGFWALGFGRSGSGRSRELAT